MRLPRRLDAPERPAQIIEFPFIGQFLAFGNLDQFQNFVNPVNQLAQAFGNFGGMRHRLVNRGGIGRAKISGFDPGFERRGILPTLMPMWLNWLRAGGRHSLFGGRRRWNAFRSRSGRRHFGRLRKLGLPFGRSTGFGDWLVGMGNIPRNGRLARFIGRTRAASASTPASAAATTIVGAASRGRQIQV